MAEASVADVLERAPRLAMIVLPRKPIACLVKNGELDVWTLNRGEPPKLNIVHVVRTRSDGETITRAKGTVTRPGVLQDLTYPEALRAGFRTREDLWDHFRLRFATGPLVSDRVRCWVTTYEQVRLDIPQFPARGGGYTVSAFRSVDVDVGGDGRRTPLAAVRDRYYLGLWSRKAEEDRLLRVAERKAAWKAQWRARRDAA